MKLSIIAASLLSAIALAAPVADAEPASFEVLEEAKSAFIEGRSPPGYTSDGSRFMWGGKFGPIPFNRQWRIVARPGQVVNGTEPTGGKPGAIGYYAYGVNTEFDLICYHILLRGFEPGLGYQSLAKTATHIHQAARGASGPPRIALPNPVEVGDGSERVSVGCLQGPFTTGLNDTTTGEDTGTGFTVSMLEANPRMYMTDVHTTDAVPGAVRGQFGPGRLFFGAPAS